MRATRDHKGFTIVDDATKNEFHFRHQSFRRHQSILSCYNQKFESAKKIDDNFQKNEILSEAMPTLVSDMMRGWSIKTDDPDIAKIFDVEVPKDGQVDLPFKPELLGEAISNPDFSELFNMFMKEINPEPSPNSGSPAQSPQAKFAPTVGPEIAATSENPDSTVK